MSRYYISHPERGSWKGVTEVPDGQETHYLQHREWPERSTNLHPFLEGYPLSRCADPRFGWWMPLMDDDFIMDEGL